MSIREQTSKRIGQAINKSLDVTILMMFREPPFTCSNCRKVYKYYGWAWKHFFKTGHKP